MTEELRIRFVNVFLMSIFILALFFVPARNIQSQSLTVEELRQKIEQTRLEKIRLDAENKKLEEQIERTNKEAQTLQNAVKSLDTTERKIQNDIKATQNKIGGAELTIQKLGIEIGSTEGKISQGKKAIAASLRHINESDDRSMIEIILQKQNLNEVWDDVESLTRIQQSVKDHVGELASLKDNLEDKKVENEAQKNSLVSFKSELSTQKDAVEETKKVKASLLTSTKSKEAEYRRILQRNIELGKKFEQELFKFESELQIKIDKSKFPTEQEGVISWPLDSVYITQKFGRTVDAKRLYVSGTHNGVDFRASVGTPVKSVLPGTILGVGNTDDQAGCYSYGRWVLIKHDNGISSLYAHLSSAKVNSGERVSAGQVIALSGGQPGTPGAGYSTGPHLHLGLFASEGVQIKKYTNSNFCKKVSIPIASTNAYLDPLAYLPPLN